MDQEIEFYTSGTFRPTEIRFNGQTVDIFGETAVVITDCNYGLLLDGKPTTRHFVVTGVYAGQKEEWK
ncbi:MAG: nuclear transport factor 2 family protein [Roseburia sp.]|nr:nuclear transport factor 2 family protein [Roseburia sp.]